MPTFEKYGWLNNPPEKLVENLRAQVQALRQEGDDKLFAKLRGTNPPDQDRKGASVKNSGGQTKRSA